MAGQIFVAAATAYAAYEGRQVVLSEGRTTAREGHPVIAANPDLWVPLVPTFEAGPDQEPVKSAKSAKQAAAPEPAPAPASAAAGPAQPPAAAPK